MQVWCEIDRELLLGDVGEYFTLAKSVRETELGNWMSAFAYILGRLMLTKIDVAERWKSFLETFYNRSLSKSYIYNFY